MKGVGIVIDQAQVKQEAYRLGLLKIGPRADAARHCARDVLADDAADVEDSGRRGRELERHRSPARVREARPDGVLRRDEQPDDSGAATPRARSEGRRRCLNALPDWVRQTILVFGGMLAVLGPTIILIAKLTQAITVLARGDRACWLGRASRRVDAALSAPVIIGGSRGSLSHSASRSRCGRSFTRSPRTLRTISGSLLDVKKLMGGATDMDTQSPARSLQREGYRTRLELRPRHRDWRPLSGNPGSDRQDGREAGRKIYSLSLAGDVNSKEMKAYVDAYRS
jgi:hypothetical protein